MIPHFLASHLPCRHQSLGCTRSTNALGQDALENFLLTRGLCLPVGIRLSGQRSLNDREDEILRQQYMLCNLRYRPRNWRAHVAPLHIAHRIYLGEERALAVIEQFQRPLAFFDSYLTIIASHT